MSEQADADAGAIPPLFDEARGVYLVPVRHHSPACTRHLRALIEEVRPAQILVEAPRDFEPLIPTLTDPATRTPVAIVAFPKVGARAEHSLVSYYPFCAHSPEHLALVEAAARGAVARFIDLPSTDRMMAVEDEDEGGQEDREVVLSLTDEHHLTSGDYVAALCRRTGCRDQNELWDHLFESRVDAGDWRSFFADVGAYCAHIRATHREEALVRDGTVDRERQMRACIAEALADGGGPIVVVTGGFHTPALAPGDEAGRRPRPKAGAGRADAYLIRYGFVQLDRLNGYAAGLPAPGYYDRLWRAVEDGARGEALWRGVAAEIVGEFAARLRAEQPALTPPLPALRDTLESAVRLARLRGRAGPGREDLLDACRSNLVKEELVADRSPLLDALAELLTGSAIGDIPPSAGSPPLVEAARTRARGLGFTVSDGARRNRQLDVYRKPRHREASHFLHAMGFLGTGFGSLTAGPDFLSGVKLDLLHETWSYAWSPQVEARLIELAAGAETVNDACVRELGRRIRALGEEGKGRSASEAVALFLAGCQTGIGERALAVLPLIEREVNADASLASVAAALRELHLLWRAREVLAMQGAGSVERLIGVAYARAIYLLPSLAAVPEDRLGEALDGLACLREVIAAAGAETEVIDQALFDEAVGALADADLPPVLAGAVAALGFLAGLVDEARLAAGLRGELGGAYTDPAACIAFLRGLLAMSRELLWRVPELMEAVDEILALLDADRFTEMLPHLRLAFAALDPRETDRLARGVADRHGVEAGAVAGAVRYDVGAEEVAANLALSQRLVEQLRADGLETLLEATADTGR